MNNMTSRSDNSAIMNLHQEKEEYETEIKELRVALRDRNSKLRLTRKRLREELKNAHRAEYDVFYNKLMNLKSIELILSGKYSSLKLNLLKELRCKAIDNLTYRKLIKEAKNKANKARECVYEFYSYEIEKIFGSYKNLFRLKDLEP